MLFTPTQRVALQQFTEVVKIEGHVRAKGSSKKNKNKSSPIALSRTAAISPTKKICVEVMQKTANSQVDIFLIPLSMIDAKILGSSCETFSSSNSF